MTKLPIVKPKDVVKTLQKAGFYIARKGKGSHLWLKHPDGRHTSVAIHNKPIAKGTLSAILNQTEISKEEFLKLL